MIDEFDKDGDGMINNEEFAYILKQTSLIPAAPKEYQFWKYFCRMVFMRGSKFARCLAGIFCEPWVSGPLSYACSGKPYHFATVIVYRRLLCRSGTGICASTPASKSSNICVSVRLGFPRSSP